ncbi:FAD/NAD(P)-binding domain-containing protein, partial [Sarocladium strictum]
KMDQLDLVVIGTGTYGLAAAKQYYCQHPDSSIALFESSNSVGGTWSNDRLYPGLKSNNLVGTYEYPDFPMTEERFGVPPRNHVPGTVIHEYLEAYAKEFGIFEHVRFNTKVFSAEHLPEGGWILETAGPEGTSKVSTHKLIVATGLTSEPIMPHIKGQEDFDRPLFHIKDFRKHEETIKTAKRVTVFGGTKSAWDAVYAYGTRGIPVDWIIRPTGHGPCWMSPPFVTPLKKWLEKLVSKYIGYQGVLNFYHRTAVGRAITNGFWNTIANDVITLMGFDKHPECAKLKPTAEALHTGTCFSILNYDTDFFEPIRNGTVKIHEADLSHLSEGKVHLDDTEGTVLESDAFLCVTGWKQRPPMKFLPEGIERKIGLAYVPTSADQGLAPDESLAAQEDLLEKADAEIQARFPRLTVPMNETPATEAETAPNSPYTTPMLYHFMVPGTAEFLRTKDLAFAGQVTNFSNVICAHIQGLWISSFFDGKLTHDVHWQTVLHNRFGKWRYPKDAGAKHPDFVFEAVQYLDMMMADMGLKVHRKSGWLKEITDPYGPEDYRDINDELNAKFSKDQ